MLSRKLIDWVIQYESNAIIDKRKLLLWLWKDFFIDCKYFNLKDWKCQLRFDWVGFWWFYLVSRVFSKAFFSCSCTTYTLTCATRRIFEKFSEIVSGSVAGAYGLPPFVISRIPDVSRCTGLIFCTIRIVGMRVGSDRRR